jgi:CrcB protein
LRWRSIGLVALGGTFGTAARFTLSEAVPTWSGVPVATFAVNVLGAFLLGMLVTNLARRGRDVGVRRAVRLLVGTGFMGGFTTYSTLAVETDALFRSGQAGLAVGYAVATVIVGALAAAAGIRLASRRRVRGGGR